jgi:hypothetical protein
MAGGPGGPKGHFHRPGTKQDPAIGLWGAYKACLAGDARQPKKVSKTTHTQTPRNTRACLHHSPPQHTITFCAPHAHPLLPTAMAFVSYGFVLVRVRVRFVLYVNSVYATCHCYVLHDTFYRDRTQHSGISFRCSGALGPQ